MKAATTVMCLCSLAVIAGCQQNGLPPVQAEKDGLALALKLPARKFAVGDTFTVRLTAANATDKDMTITPKTASLAIVRLWRQVASEWVEIKRYPAASSGTAAPGGLPAGKDRSFTVKVTVEKDWPMREPLRLTAEIRGRKDPVAGILIQAFATKKECDRAKVY